MFQIYDHTLKLIQSIALIHTLLMGDNTEKECLDYGNCIKVLPKYCQKPKHQNEMNHQEDGQAKEANGQINLLQLVLAKKCN